MSQNGYIEVPQPAAIKNYNKYMGGIDLLDRIIGKYPMRGRTGKWTIRTIFHFFDFAAAAGWVQYRDDAAKSGLQRKDIDQYLDFKLDLAKQLIYSGPGQSQPHISSPQLARVPRNTPHQSPRSSCIPDSPTPIMNERPSTSTRKQRLVEPIPHIAKRKKEAKHLPTCAKGAQNNRSKCRNKGCRNLTVVCALGRDKRARVWLGVIMDVNNENIVRWLEEELSDVEDTLDESCSDVEPEDLEVPVILEDCESDDCLQVSSSDEQSAVGQPEGGLSTQRFSVSRMSVEEFSSEDEVPLSQLRLEIETILEKSFSMVFCTNC
ncbi:hypothetical protein EVAR_87156_1 [Eumeta japonica]|uniref:PiggyBac transposable element-derived protein domain-containing protein n=1 Tax=Eumeta variegata TaxID=151549 RepID=A0A4C1VXQ8_EUMVA|nr:hypothetical protein EVAR_87156_1 [Eumeta japonica]